MERSRAKTSITPAPRAWKSDAQLKKVRSAAIKPNHVLLFMMSVTALGVLSFFLSHEAIANRFYPNSVATADVRLSPEVPEPALDAMAPPSGT